MTVCIAIVPEFVTDPPHRLNISPLFVIVLLLVIVPGLRIVPLFATEPLLVNVPVIFELEIILTKISNSNQIYFL